MSFFWYTLTCVHACVRVCVHTYVCLSLNLCVSVRVGVCICKIELWLWIVYYNIKCTLNFHSLRVFSLYSWSTLDYRKNRYIIINYTTLFSWTDVSAGLNCSSISYPGPTLKLITALLHFLKSSQLHLGSSTNLGPEHAMHYNKLIFIVIKILNYFVYYVKKYMKFVFNTLN